MSFRLYFICTVVVLFLVGPASAGNTATIHGVVYKCDTFKPLNNALIEVNSTPTQVIVAKNGQYSVDLVPGNYTIRAKYYQNSSLTYAIEETLEINDGDNSNYMFDLLLPPVTSEGLMDGSKVNRFSENLNENTKSSFQSAKNLIVIDKKNNSNSMNITEQLLEPVPENPKKVKIPFFLVLINSLQTPSTKQSILYFSILYYLLIALISFFLLAGNYRFLRTYKKIEKSASEVEKTEHILRNLFKLLNIPNILVKISAKDIDSEMRQEFNVNAGEAISLTELESKIPVRKMPAESGEKYPAQETEFVELGLEKDNKKTYLEEPTCNLEIETPALENEPLLSKDLQEVIDVTRSKGGMITQKDLRSSLKYSEVKVSLMLSNLERRKRIKKFKMGRENLVILMDANR